MRGSLAAQLISFLALLVLARLYSPQDFGVAQAMMSVLTVLLIASSLRLEIALVTTPEPLFMDVFRCAWWLCIATSMLALLVVLPLVAVRADWSLAQRVGLLLLPMVGLFAGWNQVLSYVALRRQLFSTSSNAKIVQAAAYSSGALLLGVARPSSTSLLLAETLGRGAAVVYTGRGVGICRDQLARPSSTLLRSVLRRHRELVTTGLFAAMVNTASSAFTVAMLLLLFTADDAGQFAMIERFVGMPIALLVGAYSQVFMVQLSASLAIDSTTNPSQTLRRLLRIQTMTAGLLMLALLFVAPPVLLYLLGPDWRRGSEFLRPLALLYVGAYIVGPFNMALSIAGKQRLQLLSDSLRLAAMALMWLAAWQLELDVQQTLWLYAIVSVGCLFSYLAIADTALKRIVTASTELRPR